MSTDHEREGDDDEQRDAAQTHDADDHDVLELRALARRLRRVSLVVCKKRRRHVNDIAKIQSSKTISFL